MPTAVPIPRPEHPRPDFVRNTFYNLNGTWQFAFDDDDRGLAERWQDGRQLPLSIVVPFCYQSEKSGLGGDEIHPILWYRRSFSVPKDMQGQRILLRFGAVDYACDVYINGTHVGHHVGGYSPFALDITLALQEGDNDLCLRVTDYPDCTQTRGKQYWKRGLMGCWYTPTSGIWQTVYLEAVGARHFTQIHVTPDIDRQMATAELALDIEPLPGTEVELTLSFQGEVLRTLRTNMPTRHMQVPFSVLAEVGLRRMHLWSPGNPNLYDLNVKLLNADAVLDEVNTYFGMRKVEVAGGEVLLNNHTIYQRLVLDQGYYPDGILTAPTDEALRRDIELSMAAGFNGARLHQKVFEERFLYHADRLGYLVWGEFGDWGIDRDRPEATYITQWLEVLERDYSHPSIIGWCPLNETGQPIGDAISGLSDLTRGMFLATKAMDTTRPVLDASGYSHRVPESDIYDSHDYEQDPEKLRQRQAGLAEGKPFQNGPSDRPWSIPYRGQPYFVSEFGGIWWNPEARPGEDSWGYGERPKSLEEFYERFEGLCAVLLDNPLMFGYCYTQLTDVYQEQNGIYTFDRRPKFDLERIRRAQTRKAAIEK